jgi:hypothetical protein
MPRKRTEPKGEFTPVEKRFTDAAVNIRLNDPQQEDIGFITAGLCHVFFPYTDPGDDTEIWIRKHGNYTLTMQPTLEYNPETEKTEKFGLPFGARPRMMLALLNTISLQQKTPNLSLGNSLTEFIGTHLQLDTNGRTIREIKNQLARLASADIKINYNLGGTKDFGHSARQRMPVIRDLDIWWSRSPNQRHFWGNALRFSDDYYNALQEHGVPLDLRALRAISNKPMAIDLYSFLAHRLHVLDKPLFITWKAMKDQFGYTYKAMHHFKADFRQCLKMVMAVYPAARVQEEDNKGFILLPSHPPIAKTVVATTQKQEKEYVFIPAPAAPKKRIAKPKSTPQTPSLERTNDTSISVGNALQDLFATIIKADTLDSKSKKD